MELATTDAELVAASRRGERRAYATLIERHLDAVWAVSFSSTRDRALSDDVVQDTFVAAWGRLDRLREVDRVRAWLCGIARNLARKALRRATRERPAEAEVAGGATPFDELARLETDRLVEQALAELPATYRDVMVLYYQHERSLREVAAALGVSEDAAMQRLTRGRRLLATHVVEVVEGSLVARRPRRAAVAAILAVLPSPPASVAASSMSSTSTAKGTSMLKLAAIFAAVAATAGATYSLTRSSPSSSSSTTAPKVAAAIPGEVNPSAAGRNPTASAPRPTPHVPAAPAQIGAPGCDTCEHPPARPEGERIDAELAGRVGLYSGPSKGPADAPVQIAVYQDLECPYCEMVMATLDELWAEYPGKLRLVVKDYPLPHHTSAALAAEAARAADAQGKLWEFREAALASRDDLSRAALIELARGVGLDVARFTRELDEHRWADAIAADLAGGRELSVDGTPSFFINGRRFTGAQPVAAFRAAIDQALLGQ